MNSIIMKLKKVFITVFFLFLGFSCKTYSRTTYSSISNSLLGLWIGTYLYDQRPENPPEYFSFLIKPDHTILVTSKGAGEKYYAKGLWKLTKGQFVTTYTTYRFPNGEQPRTQTSVAVLKHRGLLTGKWRTAISVLATGTFTLKKIY